MTDKQDNTISLKGRLMWPKLFQMDTFYDPKWKTDLLLDADGLKVAKERALRVKKKEAYEGLFEGYNGSYVEFTRPERNAAGDRNDPPEVLDAKLRPVPSSIGLGNGTIARVSGIIKTRGRDGEMSPSEAMKKYKGYGLFLIKAKILDLVPYEKQEGEEDFIDDEGSFFVDNMPTSQKPSGNTIGDDDIPF